MELNSVATIAKSLPTDWIVLGALAAVLAFDSLRSGSGRASALALSAPLAMVLGNALPTAFLIGSLGAALEGGLAQAAAFFVFFGVLAFFINRIVFSYSDVGRGATALVAAGAATAVLVVVWLQMPALQGLYQFGPQVQAVFGEAYRFWWLLGAFAGLAFARS